MLKLTLVPVTCRSLWLDNLHIGLLPLQRLAERLARPKDRRVKSQRAPYRCPTLALSSVLNAVRLGKVPSEVLGRQAVCGSEEPNLQKVDLVASLGFFGVGYAGASDERRRKKSAL